MMKEYKNKNWLKKKYIDEGQFVHNVALLYRVSWAEVCRYLKQYKISIRDKSEALKLAWKKGRCFNLPKYRTGKYNEFSANWKGGRFYRNGYVALNIAHSNLLAIINPITRLKYTVNDMVIIKEMTKGRTMLEHRLIMALKLQRPLKIYEIIHHKNGVKDDNRLENLELFSDQKHKLEYKELLIENKRLKQEIERLSEELMVVQKCPSI